MVLEESPSKRPDAGEDKVNLIKFTRRISRSIMVCQQAFQQGTQRLNVHTHKNTNQHVSRALKNHEFLPEMLISTCTMLFSGMGVMVLRLQRTCSRQCGTYLSNRMVRFARSDWACLVSIQLATYLRKHERKVKTQMPSVWFCVWGVTYELQPRS